MFFLGKVLKFVKAVIFTGFIFCNITLASENKMLNTLIERGILTEQEALNVKKQSAQIEISENSLKSFSIWGRLQYQYSSVSVDDNYKSETASGLEIRRIYLGAIFQINSNWDGTITGDLLNGSSPKHKLTTTYIRRQIDTSILTGNIRFGFDADNFGYEDMLSSGYMLTIERSIATRFFSCDTPEVTNYNQYAGYGALKFGADSIGIYANGYFYKYPKVMYGMSITSPESLTIEPPPNERNIPNFWFNVRYNDSLSVLNSEFNFELGSYSGIAPQGSVVLNGYNKYGYTYGLNPFFTFTNQKLSGYVDFIITTLQYGRPDATQCTPWGANFAIEYKLPFFFGDIAPIVRFSYLDTDGRGARVNESVRNAPSIYDDFRQYYDKAMSFYAGLNWYIYNYDLRLQMAYERSKFWGDINNNNVSDTFVDAIRIQIQLLF